MIFPLDHCLFSLRIRNDGYLINTYTGDIMACDLIFVELATLSPVHTEEEIIKILKDTYKTEVIRDAINELKEFLKHYQLDHKRYTSTRKPPKKPLKLSFVGDIMVGRNVRDKFREKGYPYPFGKVKELFDDSTYVCGNMECPLTIQNQPEEFPIPLETSVFQGDPEIVESFKYAGFNILTLANNHIIDFGVLGLQDTIKLFDSHQIKTLGAHWDLDKVIQPVIVEEEGYKIGFLTYSAFFKNLYPGRVKREFDETIPATSPLDLVVMTKQIIKIREQVDYLVVALHAGKSNQPKLIEQQTDSARLCIALGSDLVIGHHPHMLQAVEIYNNKPIVYSLGNFVFDHTHPINRESAIFNIVLEKNIKCKMVPIWINDDYEPVLPEEAKQNEILKNIKDYSQYGLGGWDVTQELELDWK